MNVAIVSTCLYAEELENKINEQFKQITFPIFIPTYEVKKQKQITYLYYDVEDTIFLRFYNKFLGEKIRIQICKAIFNMIQEKIQYELLREMIEKYCCTMSVSNRNHVFTGIKKWLTYAPPVYIKQQQRVKKTVLNDLLNCMEENKEIHIEGFIQFRMKSYKQYLKQLIKNYIHQWNVQQEYNRFIELLQFFLSVQPSKMSILHVIAHKDGRFTFLDDQAVDITDRSIQVFMKELQLCEWSYEDILLSTIIHFIPAKIIIHKYEYIKNLRMIKTLQYLFTSNLVLCAKCNLCI